MTNAELSALPEWQEYDVETLPTGETVKHHRVPQFAVYTHKPDDVIMFTDADGTWFVNYHIAGGTYKRRAPFG
jgi:hypothetical protein